MWSDQRHRALLGRQADLLACDSLLAEGIDVRCRLSLVVAVEEERRTQETGRARLSPLLCAAHFCRALEHLNADIGLRFKLGDQAAILLEQGAALGLRILARENGLTSR